MQNLFLQNANNAPVAQDYWNKFSEVRLRTQSLVEPLEPEDLMIQCMESASPTKWHLGHTTWFFEAFLLVPLLKTYQVFDESFHHLFNSYYESMGDRQPRANRGQLSRPSLREVWQYRQHVNRWVGEFLESADNELLAKGLSILTVGLHHEQQHQELILMDIKYNFSCNPVQPRYAKNPLEPAPATGTLGFDLDIKAGVREIGANKSGFHFDNEFPRHKQYIPKSSLANRLVTCGEYLEFMNDKGYQRPELWLSDGWTWLKEQDIEAPLYWTREDHVWKEFTLHGEREVDTNAPVCHMSFYEADAYARWRKADLPSESSWETLAESQEIGGQFLEPEFFHPTHAHVGSLYGGVWQWTSSAYRPYPGYRPPEGAIGEYNGKFMCNQFVLRGGSCFTDRTHIRHTYRNFFYPSDRWQMSGIRLASYG